jgi:LuxR family maltose regulon positive regulatory protein
MRSEAAIALAGAYWAMGDVVQTKKAFGIARDEALKINYQSMAAGTTTFIALQQIKQGLLGNAVLTLQNGLRLATLPDGSEMPMAGFANCHLGDIFREQNQLEKAAEYLDRGIAQCRRLGQPDLLSDAYICFARYQLTVGELNEVHAILESADQLARESKVDPWILCWLDDCRIRAWLADNNQEAIDSWLETCNLSINSPLDYQQDLHHQNLARVLVARQNLKNSQKGCQEADLLLNRLQVAAKLAGWVHEEIKILVLKAINDKSAGFSDGVIQSLLHAVILAQPGDYLRVFLDEGEILFELFKALDNLPDMVLKNGLKHIKPDTHSPQLTDLKVYISKIRSSFYRSSGEDINKQTDGIPTTLGKFVLPNSSVEKLTGREKEVLSLLAKGYPDKKIAETLVITRETVHKHLKNIYSKLDVHSRTEAVIKAQENKLL